MINISKNSQKSTIVTAAFSPKKIFVLLKNYSIYKLKNSHESQSKMFGFPVAVVFFDPLKTVC